ncbi:MAG TPA: DNA replication and repair protein RecF [Patescibacteria group bacterium]|jgi:DNA replication and repair protein RecF|nr:DNA replication and repair protein RecF [Patescibacteria group bacterium]
MRVSDIRLKDVRSYELFSAALDPELTLLLGRNGTGKTTLLEALYYLCQGTSFRGRDREMIAHNTTRADLQIELASGQKRRASLQQTAEDTIKKSFIVDEKQSQRLLARHRLPVVLFEPDELRLLSSSPERRRKFFDGILSRLYPGYSTILARYQRTLLQRNELLKHREQYPEKTWDDQLFIWDLKFAELALEITRQRREFALTTNAAVSELYTQIAQANHRIAASYHSSVPDDNYQQRLLDRLHSQRLADSYRGYTSSGPHRDDFLVTLDGHLAQETASRGEMRSIMLAYKILEVRMQQEAYGEPPLILLDDVFSELDTTREHALMELLAGHQTIITATDVRGELKKANKTIEL